MKIVVAGGAGYIGSNVVAQLLTANHEVIVLDSLIHGHRDAVPVGASFIEADVADFQQVFSKDDNIDAVFHFAALIEAGESVRMPELYWENNTVKSLILVQALHDLGIKKLIFSSTAAVYGNPTEIPITESAATVPTNPYGMTKLAVDMAIADEPDLAATSLRYFNVAGASSIYGERHPDESHLIPLALAATTTEDKQFTIFGNDYPTPDGTCVRDYIHVEDLAAAHILALNALQPAKHTIYNLGNGTGFSNKEVLETVEKVTGTKLTLTIAERREGDPAVLVASNELAKQELGWTPNHPDLEKIIGDAWEFYQANNK